VSLQSWLQNSWLVQHATTAEEIANLLALSDRDRKLKAGCDAAEADWYSADHLLPLRLITRPFSFTPWSGSATSSSTRRWASGCFPRNLRSRSCRRSTKQEPTPLRRSKGIGRRMRSWRHCLPNRQTGQLMRFEEQLQQSFNCLWRSFWARVP